MTYLRRLKYDHNKREQREKMLSKKRTCMRDATARKVGCDSSGIHPWILNVFDDSPHPKMDYDTE